MLLQYSSMFTVEEDVDSYLQAAILLVPDACSVLFIGACKRGSMIILFIVRTKTL